MDSIQRRVYSYANQSIVWNHSPYILDIDREELKKLDGEEVLREIPEKELVIVNDPWGSGAVSMFFSRFENEPAITYDSFKLNLKAQKTCRELVNSECYTAMRYKFVTLAYILFPNCSGFALVSCVDSKYGMPQFELHSNLYILPPQMHTIMENGLRNEFFGYFPTGRINHKNDQRVYLTSVDRIEKCIRKLVPNSTEIYHLDINPITKYLLCFKKDTEKSQELKKIYISQSFELMRSSGFEEKNALSVELGRPQAMTSIQVKKGTKYEKVQSLKDKGYSIGQVAKRLGLAYKTVSQLWE